MNKRFLAFILLLTLATSFIVGCRSNQYIEVYDPSGKPIANAQVVSRSLSMDTGPEITNSKGQAGIPENIQGVKWIRISKPGYETIQTEIPTSWPMRVTITPIATTSASSQALISQ